MQVVMRSWSGVKNAAVLLKSGETPDKTRHRWEWPHAGVRRKCEEHTGKGIKEGNDESWSPREGKDDPTQGQAAERTRRFVVVCSMILSQRKTRMWWAQRV